MEIKNVLFDLDGTLLPMDMEAFTNGYFGLLTQKMAPRGYDPKRLIDAVWAGTAAMVKNDGSRTNEERKDVNAWPHGGFADLIRFVCGSEGRSPASVNPGD